MEPNRLFGYMNEHKVTSVGWSVSAFKVLPGFMVPRKVKQVSALPKLASGKIDTVADVLVREVELSEVSRNDVILFHRCGA